jgi:DNA-binding beta-propeller fold protein YncE
MMMRTFSGLAVVLAAIIAAPAAGAVPAPHYRLAGSISGPDGGWDLLSVDSAHHRLFVARSDALDVVTLDGAGAVRPVGTLARGHGAVPIPPGDRVLVTSGNDDRARIYNVASGRLLFDVAVGHKPDAAIWDARLGAVLVMNAQGGTVSVVDPNRGAVVRTIPLGAGLELPVVDDSGTLFVNSEEANLIYVADPASGRVMDPIALPGCEGPTGLAYDRAGHRLISACANGKAAVVDIGQRREIQLIDIGRGPDGAVVDQERGLAFIPCGRDGELDLIPLRGHGPLAVTERIPTETGARTIALDPRTGRLYLPTARFGPAPAVGGRAPALSGSFHILIVAPD